MAMALTVVGLGDPVLDIVARVDDALLQRLGAEPGGCVPVDAAEMAALLALPEVAAQAMRVPGGSAANVLKGLAGLAGSAASGTTSCSTGPALATAFVGMVGRDAAGAEYRASIAAHGVAPLLLESGSGAATATCLCLVTPDGQRTMRTSLCAARELDTPQLLPPQLGGATAAPGAEACAPAGPLALLHCEGYCLYRAGVAAAAMHAAHAAGARVSIDLASFEVVQSCWAALDGLLQERLVDIAFCNEQEALALCEVAGLQLPPGASPEQQVAAAQDYLLGQRGVGTVVVSRGGKGCVAKSACGASVAAPAASVPVVDTVGAGDYFTAGTLFGLLGGASLGAATRCGCAAGTAAVQTAGAELGEAALQQVRRQIGAILAADREQQQQQQQQQQRSPAAVAPEHVAAPAAAAPAAACALAV